MSKQLQKRVRTDSSLDLKAGRISDALSPQLIELINQRFAEQTKHISCSVREHLIELINQRFDKQPRQMKESEERFLREIENKFETKFINLTEKCNMLGKRVEELEENNTKLSALYIKIEELEAKVQAKAAADAEASIANDVRVHGVPIVENENLKNLLNGLFYSLGLTPLPKVKEIFRVKVWEHSGHNVIDPVIIIKFETRRYKIMLLKRAGEHRRQTKQPLSLELFGIQAPTPFYINEQLTKSNYNIFKEAMKMKKHKVLSAVYTRQSLVYARQSVGGEFVCLKSMEDLAALQKPNLAAATEAGRNNFR